MTPFQKVGVLLKNTPTDEAVLAFAAHMAQLGAQEFACVHVAREEGDPPVAALDAKTFEAKVHAALPKAVAERTTCRVLEGDHLRQLLRLTRDEDLDLAIIGRKLPSSQTGVGTKIARIVRKAPCSVMIVPELCRPHFGRALVAVDCSDHSKQAMDVAIEVVKASGEPSPQILAVTVRQVASRYDLAGVTFEESVKAQQAYGKKDLDAFLADVDVAGIPIETLVLLSDAPALAITHAAMARKMDIVVAGSRGATSAAATLLGSTSEQLLLACAMPILIVKQKGETLNFLEALFSTG